MEQSFGMECLNPGVLRLTRLLPTIHNFTYDVYFYPTNFLELLRSWNLISMYFQMCWVHGQKTNAIFGGHVYLQHGETEIQRNPLYP